MTAHRDKLVALRANAKLPAGDHQKVDEAIAKYGEWIAALDAATGTPDEVLVQMVAVTNSYKLFIELDLIFDSENDFLYRQKGQLKLDNTILEEFLPRLVDARLVPGLGRIEGLTSGPQACFAGFYVGPIAVPVANGGIFIKTKNQDFTVGRRLFLKASTDQQFPEATSFSSQLNIGYFVAEIKTNLDKTMFQEAAATARELKSSVRESIYVLLCEWLDMPPIDTRMTDIDRVVLLRRAKRLPSNIRESFSTYRGRQDNRARFLEHLTTNPLSVEAFKIVVQMLNEAFPAEEPISEATALQRGYF